MRNKVSYPVLYKAEYHIGKSTNGDVLEYLRRPPAQNTHKFDGTPLLIHTNTNDDYVNVLEIVYLTKSLKVKEKPFDYALLEALPGDHSVDRMDTKIGKGIRLKGHQHLPKYLKPNKPFKNRGDSQKAGYQL